MQLLTDVRAAFLRSRGTGSTTWLTRGLTLLDSAVPATLLVGHHSHCDSVRALRGPHADRRVRVVPVTHMHVIAGRPGPIAVDFTAIDAMWHEAVSAIVSRDAEIDRQLARVAEFRRDNESLLAHIARLSARLVALEAAACPDNAPALGGSAAT